MIKTMWNGLSISRNGQTLLSTFLIEPFFAVLFFYLIAPHTNAGKLIITALVLTALYKIIGIYTQIFVYAQQIEVLKEIFIGIKGFLKFSGSALLISVTVAAAQSSVLFLIYRILNFQIHLSLENAIYLVMSVILFGSVFAVICGTFSLLTENPYFLTNLLTGLLPILSATIVPMGSYPFWLALLSKLLPFWTIQEIVWENQAQFAVMGIYFLLACCLLIVVIFTKRRKILSS